MRVITIDTKKTLIRDIRASITTDAFIILGFFILGLTCFLLTFQSQSFDYSIILGFIVVAVKEIITYKHYSEYADLRVKLMNVSKSMGLLTFKNSNMTFSTIDTREVLDGPIFKIIKKINYIKIEVIPDGCKNSEKIYELAHRLEEQFHMNAELKDSRYSAVYILREEPKSGRKLSRDDFR